jgi:hypothetical protein
MRREIELGEEEEMGVLEGNEGFYGKIYEEG